jgi:hypothetical protein
MGEFRCIGLTKTRQTKKESIRGWNGNQDQPETANRSVTG